MDQGKGQDGMGKEICEKEKKLARLCANRRYRQRKRAKSYRNKGKKGQVRLLLMPSSHFEKHCKTVAMQILQQKKPAK